MESFASLCVQGEEVDLGIIGLSLPHPRPRSMLNMSLAFRRSDQVTGGWPGGHHSALAGPWGSRLCSSHGNAEVREHPRK